YAARSHALQAPDRYRLSGASQGSYSGRSACTATAASRKWARLPSTRVLATDLGSGAGMRMPAVSQRRGAGAGGGPDESANRVPVPRYGVAMILVPHYLVSRRYPRRGAGLKGKSGGPQGESGTAPQR